MSLSCREQLAKEYALWSQKELGQIVESYRLQLIQQCLAPWPRRGRSLLEVNCGQGNLQPFLWHAGFDVQACDPSYTLRQDFVALHGTRFSVNAAAPDLLPYPDQSFDWCLVHLDASTPLSLLPACLKEAQRVTSLGLALEFWNSCCLARKVFRKNSIPVTTFNAWRVYKLFTQTRGGTINSMSVLAGPSCTWSWQKPKTITKTLATLCNGVQASTLGALCMLRLDFPPSLPLTATPLKLDRLKLSKTALASSYPYDSNDEYMSSIHRK